MPPTKPEAGSSNAEDADRKQSIDSVKLELHSDDDGDSEREKFVKEEDQFGTDVLHRVPAKSSSTAQQFVPDLTFAGKGIQSSSTGDHRNASSDLVGGLDSSSDAEIPPSINFSPIMDGAQNCKRSFLSVLSSISKYPTRRAASRALNSSSDTENEDFVSGVSDAFDRYKIWSANIGLYEDGLNSIELCLRDASKVSRHVSSLLDDLTDSLQDGLDIVNGDSQPWDQETVDENIADLGEQVGFDFNTELEQILADVTSILDSLYRLSSVIRDPAPHDQFMFSLSVDLSDDENLDVQHVGESYPEADEALIEKLEKVNLQRRTYFKYRRLQYETSRELRNPTELSRISGVSAVALLTASHLRQGIGVITRTEGDQSSDDSKTPTATSSKAWVSGTGVSSKRESIRPSYSICPFCWISLHFNDTSEWKKHILADLRPYICIEAHCQDSERLYVRRGEWIHHARRSHWMRWECPVGCWASFARKEDLSHHLETHHKDLADEYLSSLNTLGERPGKGFSESNCPLCFEQLTTEIQYEQHIGQHQEQLASLALPLKSKHRDEYPEGKSHTTEEIITNSAKGSPARNASEITTEEKPRATTRRRNRTRFLGKMKSGGRRWICPNCPNSNNSWRFDMSCPLCFQARPAAPSTFDA